MQMDVAERKLPSSKVGKLEHLVGAIPLTGGLINIPLFFDSLEKTLIHYHANSDVLTPCN